MGSDNDSLVCQIITIIHVGLSFIAQTEVKLIKW